MGPNLVHKSFSLPQKALGVEEEEEEEGACLIWLGGTVLYLSELG